MTKSRLPLGQLVEIISTDKLRLPGLLFEPPKPSQKVAVWLHGMGDSGIFYSPARINALAQALTAEGIALLAFNNRGAHNRKELKLADDRLPEEDRYRTGGTHFELIADCVYDIDGAVDFLRQRNFQEFYLLGHSSGANKICAYGVRVKNNPFSKYVLAGPGDDCGLHYQQLGAQNFKLALSYARKCLQVGKDEKIMPQYTGMYPFSAQAAADILDPDGAYNTFPFLEATTRRLGKKPLFKEYSKIKLPLLVILGEFDEYAYTAGGSQAALELFRQFTNPEIKKSAAYELVPQADHSFRDQEDIFARQVALWLTD